MSCKVLLVDDEAWVVESLKASVDWGQLGFEVAGMALSGPEALAMMESIRPDVVFTDIRMPGMSGLELIKRGSELHAHTRFIVVSGYAEFAYAQKALAYGAMAYCLKPFDEDEIVSILGKIKKGRETKRRTEESALHLYLEDPGVEHGSRLLEEWKVRGLLSGSGLEVGVIVYTTATAAETAARAPERSHHAKIGKNKYAIIVHWEQLDEEIAGAGERLPADVKGIGVSGKVTELGMLRKAIESASHLSDGYFMTGRAAVYRQYETSPYESFKESLKQLDQAIRSADVAAAGRTFDTLAQQCREHRLTVQHALQLYNIVHSFMYRYKADAADNMLYSHELLLSHYGNAGDMLQELKQFVSRHILEAPEYSSSESGNETFRTILHYVNGHFLEELSIQSLSRMFYTSPSYISQLFKKEVGETFTSYIAKLRIGYACELLADTELMVGEIAEKAGYADYFYFTKIFKKIIGKTPSQFRMEMA
ncbi:response regulator [Paenibacillus sp. J5C_2022]|uniref:response regulator transcription factor n=1 Tax=Paenibacillus sp. J5C2022 TaxID=2977129 RepID=UPI0021D3C230|nr:response regulator [Paenibacillus sp. J5C2022]MCU6712639.1 response regulator [Paenibacillus sp. J5C2022]